MAFQNKNLSVIAYANGWTMWHYNANEPMANIDGKNFFGSIWTLCAVGDLIYIVDDKGRLHQRQITEIKNDYVLTGKLGD